MRSVIAAAVGLALLWSTAALAAQKSFGVIGVGYVTLNKAGKQYAIPWAYLNDTSSSSGGGRGSNLLLLGVG